MNHAKQLAQLRRHAESRLNRLVTTTVPGLPAESIEALVHELRVHQIELELQCDELQRAHADIEAACSRYRELYESIPIGYATLDQAGLVVDLNPAGRALLGAHGEGVPRYFQSAVAERDADRFTLFCRGVVDRQEPRADEFLLRRHDGQTFVAYVQAVPVPAAINGRERLRITYKDISRRKQAEEELRRSESQLKILMQRQLSVQEEERKRIATDLHDHLQQMLVLTKLKLAQGRQAVEETSPCAQAISEADAFLTEILGYTRTLVAELSPPVLRRYGLGAALRWLASDLAKSGMKVAVAVPDHEPGMAEQQASLLFQSVRELLLNVHKHAGTDLATVALERQADELTLTVTDEGKGFESSTVGISGETAAGFGLASIHERMRLLGGTFTVVSAPGLGTRARLMIKPVAPPSTDGPPSGDRLHPAV